MNDSHQAGITLDTQKHQCNALPAEREKETFMKNVSSCNGVLSLPLNASFLYH
jgi:hypothetical protein